MERTVREAVLSARPSVEIKFELGHVAVLPVACSELEVKLSLLEVRDGFIIGRNSEGYIPISGVDTENYDIALYNNERNLVPHVVTEGANPLVVATDKYSSAIIMQKSTLPKERFELVP